MANKALFKTGKANVQAPVSNTTNLAGGRAYKFSDEHALCQYVVTGTFNGVFYASAGEQLDRVKTLVDGSSNEFVAKAAVYGHQTAKMKDVPAYLLACLAARAKTDSEAAVYFDKAFPLVVTNAKMLCNFVQIIRSGVTGRKSFGTAIKRSIQTWLTSRRNDNLFTSSIGHSDPSLADIIKMVRPKPTDAMQEATFGYLLGKEHAVDRLPQVIRDFEAFKVDNTKEVPNIPFRALTNCGLTTAHWTDIALNMPWNTLRMNLNVLERNGVFADKNVTKQLAAKLSDADEVRKNNVFPYQLLTAYHNVGSVPQSIKNALQDALEVATENVPSLNTDVACCIDLSGSMGSAVTGNNSFSDRATTVTTCYDVASLIAASLLRTNPDGTVIAWASTVKEVKVNPKDSILTNAEKFRNCGVGGGTSAQLGLRYLNSVGWKGDAVVYVSDNQSWLRQAGDAYGYYGGGTEMAKEWEIYRKRNRNAKLVCIDIQPYGDTQVPDGSNCLNIGGFTDSVWPVIENFVSGSKANFVDVVKATQL